MANQNQPIHLDFSKPSPLLIGVVGGLAVLVLFLIGVAIALTMKFVEPSAQTRTIFLVTLLPLLGLAASTLVILRNTNKLSQNLRDDFWELMLPENQRRKLNNQVRELSAILGIAKEQLGDLRAAYILAEDLAIRQIEQEKKLPLKRHIKVGNSEFDAVFLSRDVSTFVDVTFLVTSNISQKKIDAVLANVEAVKKNFKSIKSKTKIKLLLVLVTQLDAEDEAKLRESLSTKFTSTPVDVDIRLLDFESLQRIFTED